MWKARPDDKPNAQQPANGGSYALNNAAGSMPRPTPAPVPTRMADHSEIAHIGKSVVIKGELSGSEDLYLDGEVEGSIALKDHSITIGPNGKVRANIHAREVVILGKVEGNVHAEERAELKRSGVLTGDVSTQRILIEDGAYFKGSIDVQKEQSKNEGARREMAMAAAAGVSSSRSSLGEAKKF
jgi:cytoskeletal protein CcmA (bactofilin family)